MDLLAAIIAFFSVRVSGKPADKTHPYGHGKIENISGVIEGLLIFVAAFLIIKEAVVKILHPADISEAYIAIAVMVFSAVVNFGVSKILYKVAKEEDSIALEADALHLKTDVYTSLGVGVGLLLIKLTGIALLDPITAILVALLIVKEAWHLCRTAFSPLLDASLTKEEEDKIKEILELYNDRIQEYHHLRTRKAGHKRLIDFHLLVEGKVTVNEAHAICEEIESEIEKKIGNTDVNIHIEPANQKEANKNIGM
jgi:cation diffusion facilitator family transporter